MRQQINSELWLSRTEQSSQFEIDGGVNYQYGMAFNINRLLTSRMF